MSELMTDLDWWAATRYPSVHDDWRPSATTGRHAINEVAAETPIFHALSTGAWRTREPAAPSSRPVSGSRGAQRRPAQDRSHDGGDRGVHDRPIRDRGLRDQGRHELASPARPVHDPVEAFRRDPLTMPIPKIPPIPKQSAAASTEAARRAAFGAHALRTEGPQPEPAWAPGWTRRAERGRSQDRLDYPDPSDYSDYSGYSGYRGRRDGSYRDVVSDSGRHHRRRPSISSLL